MKEIQGLMFEPTIFEQFERMALDEKIKRAIALLRDNEPDDGYYLAFSGGKDSCVCKELLNLSGVKYEAHYNMTTIDPPELIYFIKKYHREVIWNKPPKGNMMYRVGVSARVPPTRVHRWCCEEFKERGGEGSVIVFGVRAAESRARKSRWSEVAHTKDYGLCICPIVYWQDNDVWSFIKTKNVPYCSLYDEGFDRMGCVGCPLMSKEKQDKEFARYPRFEEGWKRAIIRNWENWHDKIGERSHQLKFQGRFKTGEDFWRWWRTERIPDYIRGNCQSEMLWTNEPGIYDEEEL